ncbi:MAG: hypothetical protein IT379_30280 [Deltaproteobacteria bacterium]|nr:hypothetical protein [Deltaproteobacteria bacterium]
MITLNHKVTAAELRKAELAYAEEWAKEEGDSDGREIVLRGAAWLCGGRTAEEAHARMTKAMRRALGKCRVQTVWTNLEEPPTDEYCTEAGDGPDEGADRASGGCTADDAEARP